jgi:hypothetical protein
LKKKIDFSYGRRLICHTFKEKWQQKESLIVNGRGVDEKNFPSLLKITHYYYKKNVPSIVGLPLSKTEEQGTNYYIQTNVCNKTSLLFCFLFAYKINVLRYSAI